MTDKISISSSIVVFCYSLQVKTKSWVDMPHIDFFVLQRASFETFRRAKALMEKWRGALKELLRNFKKVRGVIYILGKRSSSLSWDFL